MLNSLALALLVAASTLAMCALFMYLPWLIFGVGLTALGLVLIREAVRDGTRWGYTVGGAMALAALYAAGNIIVGGIGW